MRSGNQNLFELDSLEPRVLLSADLLLAAGARLVGGSLGDSQHHSPSVSSSSELSYLTGSPAQVDDIFGGEEPSIFLSEPPSEIASISGQDSGVSNTDSTPDSAVEKSVLLNDDSGEVSSAKNAVVSKAQISLNSAAVFAPEKVFIQPLAYPAPAGDVASAADQLTETLKAANAPPAATSLRVNSASASTPSSGNLVLEKGDVLSLSLIHI
jgi:hypothetical protein